jgi:microcin C transport system substrate-binding protein
MKEAFKGGEFDVLWVSSSKDWALDFKGPYVQKNYILRRELRQSRPVGMQAFVFNLRRSVFQSQKTRYALALMFDFDWSNRNLFYGQYTRTRCFFENSPDLTAVEPPTGALKEYLSDLRTRHGQTAVPKAALEQPLRAPGDGQTAAENTRQAEILLDSVGWLKGTDGIRVRDGKRFEIELLLYEPMWQRISEPFQQRLRELGVEMKISILQPAEYEKRERSFEYDLVVNVYGHSRSPGNELIGYFGSQAADTPGGQNLMGLKNPAVDEVLGKLVAARSRADLAFQAQALDHILSSSNLLIPQWYVNNDRTLVWQRFGQPQVHCSQRFFETVVRDFWWADPEKERTLKAAMAKGDPLR